jgi:hypothetical protein
MSLYDLPTEARTREEKDWCTSKPKTPPIVCLCGSTRFREAYMQYNLSETLAGKIVLMPGSFTHAEQHGDFGNKERLFGPEVAAALDELYKRKIDLADEVLVLNIGGYIGASTLNEIDYARANGKPVRYHQHQHVWPDGKAR